MALTVRVRNLIFIFCPVLLSDDSLHAQVLRMTDTTVAIMIPSQQFQLVFDSFMGSPEEVGCSSFSMMLVLGLAMRRGACADRGQGRERVVGINWNVRMLRM